MKYLIILFPIIIYSFNITGIDNPTIKHNDKTYSLNDENAYHNFISDFLDPDFNLKKILYSKIKFNTSGSFYFVDITGYDANYKIKKIAIPLIQENKNLFQTMDCSHHSDFKDSSLPFNNYDWIISEPCKSQSCGDAYNCYVTFY